MKTAQNNATREIRVQKYAATTKSKIAENSYLRRDRDYQLAGWEQIRYWPCLAAIVALAAHAAAELV